MATSGNIDPWARLFDQDQISEILKLMLESWKTFIVPAKLLEVPITRKFCAHLRNNKDRSKHFFRIEWESSEVDDKGQETGRIDLKFLQGWDERVYFSIECKRLRVNLPSGFKSLAGEYVREGMSRYFNGKYALGLDKGGMIGYVMDGDVNEAIRDVRKAIEKHRTSLHMESNDNLRCSPCISSKRVKETLHNYGPEDHFVIYHIFLPISTILNNN